MQDLDDDEVELLSKNELYADIVPSANNVPLFDDVPSANSAEDARPADSRTPADNAPTANIVPLADVVPPADIVPPAVNASTAHYIHEEHQDYQDIERSYDVHLSDDLSDDLCDPDDEIAKHLNLMNTQENSGLEENIAEPLNFDNTRNVELDDEDIYVQRVEDLYGSNTENPVDEAGDVFYDAEEEVPNDMSTDDKSNSGEKRKRYFEHVAEAPPSKRMKPDAAIAFYNKEIYILQKEYYENRIALREQEIKLQQMELQLQAKALELQKKELDLK